MERRGIDIFLLIVVLTLVGIGLIMVLSASSIQALSNYGDTYYFFKRQLAWAVLGLGAMLFLARMDYHFWGKIGRVIILVALGILIIVLIPQVGYIAGGARRWLVFGPVVVQASEVAKFALIIYLAGYLAGKNEKVIKSLDGLWPPLLIIALVLYLIILEPDLGTAVSIGITIFLMLFAAGVKLQHLGVLVLVAAPFLYYFVMGEAYRRQRFLAFINPWKDPLDSGFHIIQSLYALGSGGLFGLGFGQSKQKFFYLPAPSTDFIFAVLGEELGLIGGGLILVLFFLLAWRGLAIAINAPDLLGTLLAVGLTAMIIVQVLINIGVVTGSLPVTGISLPFISYGGSSLVIMLSAVGILLNISRQLRS